jgi:membrane protein DedA with SNARE-associated domain/membrane-associated phospholipid phosphatase
MSGFLHSVTGFIAAYPHLAYAAVLLLALSESLPVIGAVVPGSGVIIALSALVPGGTLKFWPMLLAAFAGAVIGDGFAFWLGHRYHRAILTRWPLSRQPEAVARAEAFVTRHGDKSVFIARFTPGVRAVVPMFAGILRMPARRFFAANILSAMIWAPSHILPGVAVGASFGLFGSAAESLAIIALVVVVLAWLLLQAVRLVARRVWPMVDGLLARVRRWSAARHTPLARGLTALLDPQRPEARALLLLGLVLAGAAWLFLGILEDVVSGDPLVRADAAIYRALQGLRTAAGDAIMIAFTELGDTVVVIAVTAAVFLYLAWKRAWRSAAYWLAAVAGASALNTVIKLTLHRARPGELFYTGASAFSFPSGHSTTNMALYGFLAFLVAREVKPAQRTVVGIAAITLVLLIAMSRLYLGAHWFSDVIAGLAFGTLWLAVLMIFYTRKPTAPPGAAGLLATAVVALGVAGGANIVLHHAADTTRYAVQLPAGQSMPRAQWLQVGWKQLPAWRIDLGGETEEPLTIQWAGSLDVLAQDLSAQGWQQASALSPASAFVFLAPGADAADLPVLPRFAGGQLPALMLVRATGNGSRLVLRLWSSGLVVDAVTPVWMGSVVAEHADRLAKLLTVIDTGADANAPRDALVKGLASGRWGLRPERAQGWDGRVWLGEAAAP